MRLSWNHLQSTPQDLIVGPCGLEPLPKGPDLQSGCYIQIALSSHNPTYSCTPWLLNQEYTKVIEAFDKSYKGHITTTQLLVSRGAVDRDGLEPSFQDFQSCT